MELNITEFFNNACPSYYSASRAELGDDAGRITWENSVDAADQWAAWLDTGDKREEFRAYVRTFGAWDDAEIAAWTDAELTALLIQLIAGDIRESGLQDGTSWAEYEVDGYGRIFRADDGRVFYYIGS